MSSQATKGQLLLIKSPLPSTASDFKMTGTNGQSATESVLTSNLTTNLAKFHKLQIYEVGTYRLMRLAGHVAHMEEGRGVHKVLVGKPEGKNHWGDQDVDGKIILRWILRKWEGVVGTGWSWLRIGTGNGRL